MFELQTKNDLKFQEVRNIVRKPLLTFAKDLTTLIQLQEPHLKITEAKEHGKKIKWLTDDGEDDYDE